MYPPPAGSSFQESLKDIEKEIFSLGAHWGMITYGLHSSDAKTLLSLFALSLADLKACIHFCPVSKTGKGLHIKDGEGNHIPYVCGMYTAYLERLTVWVTSTTRTIFHLASKQEDLHASLLPLADPELDPTLATLSFPPVVIHTYPRVSDSPPFPYLTKPPALMVEGERSTLDPHIRSAHNLSYTRTLELLKRTLGPHFNLEKLWEAHTYFVSTTQCDATSLSSFLIGICGERRTKFVA